MKNKSILADLLNETRPEECVFLVGAGVSVDPPCGAPTGQETTLGLIQRLIPDTSLLERISTTAFPSRYTIPPEKPVLRFEHILDSLMKADVDQNLRIVDMLFKNLQPNMLHKLLARICANGGIVLTTNFDTCIEFGLESSKVVDIWSINAQRILPGAIVKLHGSLAGPGTLADTSTLMVTPHRLEQLRRVLFEGRPYTTTSNRIENGQLITKKAQTHTIKPQLASDLIDILTSRPLIVLGYSGMDDFDIVPLLLHVSSRQPLVWIEHSSDGANTHLSLDDIKLRYKIAGCTYTKAEMLINLAGQSTRKSDSVHLLRSHTGKVLSVWCGLKYEPQGQRRPVTLLLDEWLKDAGTSEARAIALAFALESCGDSEGARLVFEACLGRCDGVSKGQKITIHSAMVLPAIKTGNIKTARFHAQTAMALSDAESRFLARAASFDNTNKALVRAQCLTNFAFIEMQLDAYVARILFEQIVTILEEFVEIRRDGRWTDWKCKYAGVPALYVGGKMNLALLEYETGASTLIDTWRTLGRLSRLARGFGERQLELAAHAERIVLAAQSSVKFGKGISKAFSELVLKASQDGNSEVVSRVLARVPWLSNR